MRILILSMVLGAGCTSISCLYLAVPLCADIKFPIITEFKNDITEFKNDPETFIQIAAMKLQMRAADLKSEIDFSLDKIILAYPNLKD